MKREWERNERRNDERTQHNQESYIMRLVPVGWRWIPRCYTLNSRSFSLLIKHKWLRAKNERRERMVLLKWKGNEINAWLVWLRGRTNRKEKTSERNEEKWVRVSLSFAPSSTSRLLLVIHRSFLVVSLFISFAFSFQWNGMERSGSENEKGKEIKQWDQQAHEHLGFYHYIISVRNKLLN